MYMLIISICMSLFWFDKDPESIDAVWKKKHKRQKDGN